MKAVDLLGTNLGFFFAKYGFKWTLFVSFSTVLCVYCLLVPNSLNYLNTAEGRN